MILKNTQNLYLRKYKEKNAWVKGKFVPVRWEFLTSGWDKGVVSIMLQPLYPSGGTSSQ
jgi:hypothetical protein